MNPVIDSRQAAEKARIRRKMRSVLACLSSSSKSNADAALVGRLLSSDEFGRAQSVGMYVPIAKWEVDVTGAIYAGLDQGKNIALPRWNAAAEEYEFAAIKQWSQLSPGRFGILEPCAKCPKVKGNLLDAVFIPGLAFSLAGGRLGRGGGFYDRLLKDVRSARCGIAHECQLLDSLPEDPWDQKMERILTPNRSVRTERERILRDGASSTHSPAKAAGLLTSDDCGTSR